MKKILYEIGIALLALIAVTMALLDLTGAFILSEYVWAVYVDTIILILFVIDYLVRFIKAKRKIQFVKKNIFDLLAIIPFNSLFRVFRVFRLIKVIKITKILKFTRLLVFFKRFFDKFSTFLKTNGLIYSLYISLAAILLGAAAIYYIEKGITVGTFTDALWWAFVTVTTVGYGDISPHTNTGRAVAVMLMIVGIGFIGMFTSTIATYFIKGSKQDLVIDKSGLTETEKAEVQKYIEFLKSKR